MDLLAVFVRDGLSCCRSGIRTKYNTILMNKDKTKNERRRMNEKKAFSVREKHTHIRRKKEEEENFDAGQLLLHLLSFL